LQVAVVEMCVYVVEDGVPGRSQSGIVSLQLKECSMKFSIVILLLYSKSWSFGNKLRMEARKFDFL
jgi:hypothetical protein